MLFKRFGLAVLALMVFCSSAWADGKVFSTAVAAPVTTPDQRAMLYYSNGLERLVIETSFVGQGTNFAWVVPLPSVPKIEAISTNFFRYLNFSFQPHLIRESEPWWILYLLTGYLVSTGVLAVRRGGARLLLRCVAWNLFLLFAAVLILPIFATAGVRARSASIGGPESAVQLLDHQSVGIYNTMTIRGTNASALLDWLNANGFQTPSTALPAISNYVAGGWVFVAATIKRDVFAPDGNRPHPLSFTFKTEKAVYPLQLTGVENPLCTIDLFVFGPNKAEVPGFRVEYCGEPSVINISDKDDLIDRREIFGPAVPGDFKFENPEILRFAFPAAVVTKLSGALAAKQMSSDAWLNWIPFQPAVPTYHTQSATVGETLNWISGIWVFGLLLLLILAPRLQKKILRQGCLIVLLLGAVSGCVRYFTITTVEVTYHRGGRFFAVNEFRQLEACVEMLALEKTNSVPSTESAFLSELSESNKYLIKNTFFDQPLRCEPTPGNITLHTSTDGVDVFWYDFHAAPHKLATFQSH